MYYAKDRFHAKAICKHEHFNIGDIIYVKPTEFDHHYRPTLYAILDRNTGADKSYIDANTLRNRFDRITL